MKLEDPIIYYFYLMQFMPILALQEAEGHKLIVFDTSSIKEQISLNAMALLLPDNSRIHMESEGAIKYSCSAFKEISELKLRPIAPKLKDNENIFYSCYIENPPRPGVNRGRLRIEAENVRPLTLTGEAINDDLLTEFDRKINLFRNTGSVAQYKKTLKKIETDFIRKLLVPKGFQFSRKGFLRNNNGVTQSLKIETDHKNCKVYFGFKIVIESGFPDQDPAKSIEDYLPSIRRDISELWDENAFQYQIQRDMDGEWLGKAIRRDISDYALPFFEGTDTIEKMICFLNEEDRRRNSTRNEYNISLLGKALR